MAEQQSKEIAPQKRSLKLSPALGDWTTYKPVKVSGKKIQSGLYGFDRLSEEELQTAHMMHYHFAESLAGAIKKNISGALEIFSIDAFQSAYSSFVRGLTFQIVQGTITTPDITEKIFISLDMPLAEAMLDQALGSKNSGSLKRELTDAEKIAVEAVLESALPAYNKIFNDLFTSLSCQVAASPFIDPDSSINEQSSYAYFKLKISLNGIHGTVVIGYSAKLLKDLLGKAAVKGGKKPLPINRLPKEILNEIKLNFEVILGTTTISTADLFNIEAGDVLELDNSIRDAIVVKMADGKILLGQPGTFNSKLAARIVRIDKEAALKIAPPQIEVPDEFKEEFSEETTETVPQEEAFAEDVEEETVEDNEEEEFDDDLGEDFEEDLFGEDEEEKGAEE
ncbi:MAG: FliM/FliN family flagellar motor switch protein [Candidatus Margulisbacteria bacterium]|nr:FliM/FliN family flagellar motor switch protein [Candidatus Margulisiibacteriota bacterium]